MMLRAKLKAFNSFRQLSTKLDLSNLKLLNPEVVSVSEHGICCQKKPFRVELEENRTYAYCTCGHSKKQPFCDGTHKEPGCTTLRPLRFVPNQTGFAFLCGCKHTKTPPLCDGTHKTI
ncbi:unnamed protein product [Bursaphelenchus xylophilus]|uniref:(pine wood nematode) hypothetical protein n=1 Tax=Bursaphelenchus xylophilus TaxID=6326 RepID=A0A1I7SKY7_BURXY|nr:unnamed protein product [Bursaphelenchus xylophilus]CAG9129302.1 unnamed protein product [Bursaphelenchus xylophilus]